MQRGLAEMGDRSKIEWTEATWNPVTGCTKVSAGCKHCYAERLARRFGQDFSQVELHPERLELPLHWKRPRRIFVNSMSDLFHIAVKDEFIDRVFAVMALARQHTFQVLTKRAGMMQAYMSDAARAARVEKAVDEIGDENGLLLATFDWPLPNVWLGVSVEDRKWADERIPLLLQIPAALRFVSVEPMLGVVDLGEFICETYSQGGLTLGRYLDWVICGGESGPGARPMEFEWAMGLRRQCELAGVPFFMKQMGGVRDKRGRWEDLPEELRVREWPEIRE